MIWWVVFIGIIVIVLFEISKLIKPKPSFRCAFKEMVNYYAWFSLILAPMNITIILLCAWFGCLKLSQTTTGIDSIIVVNGIGWIIYGIIMSIVVYCILASLVFIKTKKLPPYYDWVDKVRIEGALKYTEEERTFIKKRDDESKAKLRARFPFLAKLCKKKKSG